jgi:alpha-galactosidase
MDDYSFHSTLASSLCMGWIADASDFDFSRGKKLLDRYLEVRHLLVGAWYPLLPYSRDPGDWIGSQYHRGDRNEGMLLVFRHANSPYRSVDVPLRGLEPEATYTLSSDSSGSTWRARGEDLMRNLQLTIPDKHRSDLIVYRALDSKSQTHHNPEHKRPVDQNDGNRGEQTHKTIRRQTWPLPDLSKRAGD